MTAVDSSTTVATVPILCGGEWRTVASDRFCPVHNPSTGRVIARTPLCTAEQADAVVEAAAAAFPAWAQTPVVERAQVMFRFHELIVAHFDELAALVTREHGKTLAEARAEVKRSQEMIEFACSVPTMILGQTMANIATDVDAETVRHPLGVCVGITPYNFPNMVPIWMYPVAIVCGNTFVLKPSEKVPLSSVRCGELMQEAGFPDGVFNIIHGDKAVVDALLTHPKVAAVSFVGSTPIARYIYETGTKHGKRVQSAGGAKNHMIVMPDADVDLATKALSASAFGCAGQRCMAGSIAVSVGEVSDPLVDALCDYAGHINVAPTDNNPDAEMGPLINTDALERVHGYLDIARKEGATVALDGREITSRGGDNGGFLVGPSVVDRVAPDMRLAKEEVFGPVLSVIRVRDLDEALAVGRQCEYGNGASIFTNDGYAARQFKHHFNAGMIGINVGVPAPMAWFPFTGWNHSFFGDLHIQGTEGVHFYTKQKMTLTRWFTPGKRTGDAHQDPVWKTQKK